MALSREQKKIAKRIVRIGRKRGESRKEIKAALETGLVESNLRNLSYGDADSAGWRQERASLYKNPTNVKASVNRFYDETSAVEDQYGSAGDLAAAVQRPAAQYRGRYQERAGEADQILKQLGGMSGRGGRGGSAQKRDLNTATYGAPVFKSTPGVDNAALRQSLLQGYLADRGKPDALLGLASGLKDAQDVAASTTLVPGERKSGKATGAATKPKGGGGKGGRGPYEIAELFWQGEGGINIKNGEKVPQGFVSGHTDHVHVAAGPKGIIKLGKLAQKMGLHVGENPHFGGVAPVHTDTSYHYRDRAIDVSGDPKLMAEFAQRVARMRKR